MINVPSPEELPPSPQQGLSAGTAVLAQGLLPALLHNPCSHCPLQLLLLAQDKTGSRPWVSPGEEPPALVALNPLGQPSVFSREQRVPTTSTTPLIYSLLLSNQSRDNSGHFRSRPFHLFDQLLYFPGYLRWGFHLFRFVAGVYFIFNSVTWLCSPVLCHHCKSGREGSTVIMSMIK